MDKSFNDDELSAIMKEIETLEDEFSVETEDIFETSSVLEDLAKLEEEISIPVAKHHEASVISFAKTPEVTSPPQSTSMNFKLSDGSHVDLNFEVSGRVVSIKITEAGLAIQTDNGISFNVPLTEQTTARKVA